ncbi:hypothetical protein SCHPADRAFT_903080 [Schizopora paradoxa]|uniref:Uncharacterized protein n=1 Tax=Schizopora paradoxa TaxID=27342 RepID=A0A0H2RS38_9AGAM|nr:hypothetical protein SCHPADRAFT_903080 [Schizopora paradoxa]
MDDDAMQPSAELIRLFYASPCSCVVAAAVIFVTITACIYRCLPATRNSEACTCPWQCLCAVGPARSFPRVGSTQRDTLDEEAIGLGETRSEGVQRAYA